MPSPKGCSSISSTRDLAKDKFQNSSSLNCSAFMSWKTNQVMKPICELCPDARLQRDQDHDHDHLDFEAHSRKCAQSVMGAATLDKANERRKGLSPRHLVGSGWGTYVGAKSGFGLALLSLFFPAR